MRTVPPLVLQDWQRLCWRTSSGGRRETLVLMPKGAAKRRLLAVVALFHLLTECGREGLPLPLLAVTRWPLYGFDSQGFVSRCPILKSRLTGFVGYREVRCQRRSWCLEGVERLIADTVDGTAAHAGLVDELHRHRSGDLYVQLFVTDSGKRGGTLCTISTAGWDPMSRRSARSRRAALKLEQHRDGAYLARGERPISFSTSGRAGGADTKRTW